MTLDKTQIVKFIYVGQAGPLSIIPLQRLCNEGFRPEAVITADKSPRLKGLNLLPLRPAYQADSLASVAVELGLSVIYWQRGCEADIEAKIAAIAPDLLIMSCFPWRIPEPLLALPRHGWWNLHPSLLPTYRGPTPLFWQARAGETQTAISLHQVETSLDSGAILAQQAVSMLDFVGRELEVELAQQGAELMQQALLDLAQNKLQPCLQGEENASYHGFPNQHDRCIATTGTASAAYRFIRLVSFAYSLWFELDGQRFSVVEAMAVNDKAVLNVPYQCSEDQLQVQFDIGVLTVKIKV